MQSTISKLESEVLSLRMQLKEAHARVETAIKAESTAEEGIEARK